MAQNPNIDDDTRARAMKSVEEKSADKPRVVGKKELEDSGMTLRDFLNKERGLTRRKDSGDTEVKSKKESGSDDAMSGYKPRRSFDEKESETKYSKPAPAKMTREEAIAQIPTGDGEWIEGDPENSASGSELGRNIKNTMNALVGTKIPVGVGNIIAEKSAMGRAAANTAKEAAARTARVAARREAAGAKEALRRDATFEGGMAKGGKVRSASSRGDGIAQRGKTRA